jgi:amidase
VYGHKPSLGTVSGRGHIPGPPGALSRPDLAILGPMARCADDLALGLDVVAGPDPADARAWRLELPPSRHESLRDFRVALWLDQPGRLLSTRVGDRIQAAADHLAPRVASLDDRARPDFDAEESHALYLLLLNAVMAEGMPPQVIEAYEAAYPGLDPENRGFVQQAIRGAALPHRRWLGESERRERLRAHWAGFFRDVDVLLCPIMPTTAFPHDHTPFGERVLAVDDGSISYGEQLFWAGLITVAHLPSTVVPVGLASDGLPVGMQVVAPFLDDRTALRFARLLEDEIGGFVAPPGYAD